MRIREPYRNERVRFPKRKDFQGSCTRSPPFPDAENGVLAAGLHRICRSFRKRAFRRTGQVPGNGCISVSYTHLQIEEVLYALFLIHKLIQHN